MNKILSILLGVIVCLPAFAASPRSRVGIVGHGVMPATQNTGIVKQSASVAVVDDNPAPAAVKDTREKEREACLNNNIGIGNTFVWASKNSNTGSYATMVEDTDNPENNVCFVKVGLKSDDSRVSVDDVAPKYFMWGDLITCGAWANESVLEERILDAKKSARVWATVGVSVGGAAVGVGAMELFGNKLIGGSVEGQAALEEGELLFSQIKSLDAQSSDYITITTELKKLKEKCDTIDNDIKPDHCSGKYYEVAKKLSL